MKKNTIIAVILSIAFLILWTRFYQVPKQKEKVAFQETTPPQNQRQEIVEPPKEAAKMRAPEEKTSTMDRVKSKITFTSNGGAVKKYEVKEKDKITDIVFKGSEFFSTYPDTSAKITTTKNAVISRQEIDGLVIQKTYLLNDDSIEKLKIELANQRRVKVSSEFKMKVSGGLASDSPDEKENIDLNKVHIYSQKKPQVVKSGKRSLENVKWFTNDNRYFLLALMPVKYQKEEIEVVPKTKTSPPVVYLTTNISLEAGEKKSLEYGVYIGGKSYFELTKTNTGLEKTIALGLLDGMAKFFLKALSAINKILGNYGWAIIILSLGIQLITSPLSIKSIKAAADMKRLQPHLKEIQQKFKNDPKRLNVEVMNLYKTHRVNPLSGCLPMLLQMPIFWALFSTLQNAYELRHAPWILWIKDLSSHDPYYVLPLLMGAGMFAQQIMSGTTHDPQNKMMSYIFPAVFTFMFLKFPSGVVLYWLMNSVLTIILQLLFLEKEVIKEHHIVKR